MKNLRPLLSINSVPAISNPVSKLLYDIIKVMKSKILPGRLLTGFCLVLYNRGARGAGALLPIP
jgi:hypothetical protein